MRRFSFDKMPLIFSTPRYFGHIPLLAVPALPLAFAHITRARLVMRNAAGQRASRAQTNPSNRVVFASLCWRFFRTIVLQFPRRVGDPQVWLSLYANPNTRRYGTSLVPRCTDLSLRKLKYLSSLPNLIAWLYPLCLILEI